MRKFQLKKLLLLSTALILGIVLLFVLSKRRNSKEAEIQLGDIFDATGASESKPIRSLASYLKNTNRANKIRLTWFSSAPNQGYRAYALYDEPAGKLSFYSSVQIGGLGNEGISPIRTHYLYSGVRNWMLYKIAKNHEGVTTASNDSFFEELVALGCKRIDLGKNTVHSG